MDAAEQILERLLVIRCQAGDPSALEELFRRHAPALGYDLRRLLHDEDLAADVQQEVWLTVLRRIGGLRAPEAFVVWLYRIARTRAIDRGQDRLRTVSLDADPDTAELLDDPEPQFTPADAAQVHAAMEKLAPHHREVLVLRFHEELSLEEIATVTDAPLSTVKSRLYRGLAALKPAFAEAS